MNRTGTVNELPAYLKDSPPFGECPLPRFAPPRHQMHSNHSTHLLISNVMMITVITQKYVPCACSAAYTCCDTASVFTRTRQRLDNQMTFRLHLVVSPCV
jgi:hypothetical protein